jgi:excisionase family DNA binding protein
MHSIVRLRNRDSSFFSFLIKIDKFTQISVILEGVLGDLMHTEVEPAMTVRDVALFLNVDEKTIYRLVSKGELPGFKVLGSWRFQRQDLEAWIDTRKKETEYINSQRVTKK